MPAASIKSFAVDFSKCAVVALLAMFVPVLVADGTGALVLMLFSIAAAGWYSRRTLDLN
jgi:hypothetical protein